ncbi:hypothetical protein QA645_14245 [Bradyrhizobium sp. CIAT3101]|uniref:hypothetical protein n=1 Tax=Bradyrhizobium sp. CIAT3101 TaxID=439387 RepID=UPI0024B0FDC8|nr:hypothetical protein [Bradyrhizobium sp. CIAT3101]WFU83854.1 hypothetical protein QA645_14245 [Bradyrhizobium sp. CIAT3101]
MNIAEIDPAEIDRELNSNGYMIFRDPEIAQTSVQARAEYVRCLQASKLHPTREKFHYTTLASEPWRKLAIGSSNGLGESYAQNLQSIYFDANDKNYPALGSLFKTMIQIRNKLMGVDLSFGSDPERERFWDACRVHHYPRGGGFMATHRDTHFPQVISAEIAKPFYQICVLLSRKNTDFFTGGGVIYDGNKQRIDLETDAGFGALVLFDGRTYHGVEDVDLDQVIDFSRTDGRLAAFVNLYSVPAA